MTFDLPARETYTSHCACPAGWHYKGEHEEDAWDRQGKASKVRENALEYRRLFVKMSPEGSIMGLDQFPIADPFTSRRWLIPER